MNEIGTLESRQETDKEFQSEVKGMEDGFYVFINYKVYYENTLEHKEHILLKQNEKMKWEIVNYIYEFKNKKKVSLQAIFCSPIPIS